MISFSSGIEPSQNKRKGSQTELASLGTHLMSGLDESLVVDALDFDVYVDAETFFTLGYAEMHEGVDLGVGGSGFLPGFCCYELESAEEAG